MRRLLLCSGRVYVDLVSDARREATPEVAVARLEQLYPFPDQALADTVEAYPSLEGICWVQSEKTSIPKLEEWIQE